MLPIMQQTKIPQKNTECLEQEHKFEKIFLNN